MFINITASMDVTTVKPSSRMVSFRQYFLVEKVSSSSECFVSGTDNVATCRNGSGSAMRQGQIWTGEAYNSSTSSVFTRAEALADAADDQCSTSQSLECVSYDI